MPRDSSSTARLTDEQRRALAGSTIAPRLARRWHARCQVLPVEDLESIGWVEATVCAAKFDADLGVPFDGFARDYVHFAMQRAVSRERRAFDAQRGRFAEGAIDAREQAVGDLVGPVDPWGDTEADMSRNASETADAVAVTHLLGAATVARAQEAEGTLIEAEAWRRALAALDRCIASLPDELRRLVELHHLHAQPMAEVASALSLSEPTARRRHREALTLLAKRMKTAGIEAAASEAST